MKIFKTFFLLIALIMTNLLHAVAQDSSVFKSKPKYPSINISSSLSSLLPSFYQNTGIINLGTEINLNENNSIYLNGGYIFPYGPLRNRIFRLNTEHINGAHFQLEYRKYHESYADKKSPNKQHKKYWGLNYSFYNTKAYRIQKVPDPASINYNVIGASTAEFHENNYEVFRISNGFNFRMGIKTQYKSGIFIDKSMLFGLRYIQSNSINKLYGNPNFFKTNQREALIFKPYDQGNSIVPQILFQIIIGYQRNK